MTREELFSKPLEERREFLCELIKSSERDCGMFSKAGGNRVKSLISRCIKKVMKKTRIEKKEFEQYISEQIDKIAKNEKYSEVRDTAVMEVIWYHCRRATEFADYNWWEELEV